MEVELGVDDIDYTDATLYWYYTDLHEKAYSRKRKQTWNKNMIRNNTIVNFIIHDTPANLKQPLVT